MITAIKDRAKRKRGRGFSSEPSTARDRRGKFDRVGSTDLEDFGPQRSVEGWILFVRNIHEEAQEDDVLDKFAEYGKVKNLHVNLDRRTGYSKGYALVEYEAYKDADSAQKELDGADLLGQSINVNWCFVKHPKMKEK